MGFGAARSAPKASMLVAFLGAAAEVTAARAAGADAFIVDARAAPLAKDDLSGLREAAGSLPLGAWTPVASAAHVRELRAAGIDFLLVEAEAPAAALLESDLGFALVLPDSPEEPFLRSLEALDLEALFVPRLPQPLTVAGQLELGRVHLLGRRPLICTAPADVSAEDLQCLRSAGVAVVLAAAVAEVARLKEQVAALPPRRPRREERPVVSLPRGQAAAEEEEDDDRLAGTLP